MIVLQRRKDWPIIENKDAPDIINLQAQKTSSIYEDYKPFSMVSGPFDEETKLNSRWKLLKGAKIVSSNIILNPYRDAFSNTQIRKQMARSIKEKIQNLKQDFQWFTISPHFYPFARDTRNKVLEKREDKKEMNFQPLTVQDPPRANQRVLIAYSVLESIFKEKGIPYSLKSHTSNTAPYIEGKSKRKRELDIFFISVDKGGAAVTSVVHMMFCSKLGVDFPDPSGRICKLVEEYQGRDLSPEETQKFGERFEEIVDDDACVIPFIHRGQNWLYSDDLDLSLISPNMSFPDLQLIKIK